MVTRRASNDDVRLGYDIKVTPIDEVTAAIGPRGLPELAFRATVHSKGRTFERTVVARGRAHDALAGIIRRGEQVVIRGFYDRPAANEGQPRGKEYITAVARSKAA